MQFVFLIFMFMISFQSFGAPSVSVSPTGLFGISTPYYAVLSDRLTKASDSMVHITHTGRPIVYFAKLGDVFPSYSMDLVAIENLLQDLDRDIKILRITNNIVREGSALHKDMTRVISLVVGLQRYLNRDVDLPYIKANFASQKFADWTRYFERQRLKSVRGHSSVPDASGPDPVELFLKP